MLVCSERGFMTQVSNDVFACWHPDYLEESHPLLIEDMLELALQSKMESIGKIIDLYQDLRLHGINSRFKKHLGGALYELKTRCSEGGVRLYFIRATQNQYFAFHAESKKEDTANQTMLGHGIEIIEALQKSQAVFPQWAMPQKLRANFKEQS